MKETSHVRCVLRHAGASCCSPLPNLESDCKNRFKHTTKNEVQRANSGRNICFDKTSETRRRWHDSRAAWISYESNPPLLSGTAGWRTECGCEIGLCRVAVLGIWRHEALGCRQQVPSCTNGSCVLSQIQRPRRRCAGLWLVRPAVIGTSAATSRHMKRRDSRPKRIGTELLWSWQMETAPKMPKDPTRRVRKSGCHSRGRAQIQQAEANNEIATWSDSQSVGMRGESCCNCGHCNFSGEL